MNNTNSVVIATVPERPTVLSGQSLEVQTVFDNRGDSAVDAPSQDVPSRFSYELRSKGDAGLRYTLSLRMTMTRRMPDRAAGPPFDTEPVPGGQKLEWSEDIADFWADGFEPGEYSLTVHYDRMRLDSPRASVTVLPMSVESFSSDVTDRRLATVVAHRAADGAVTLLHRESRVRDPREGVFVARHELPAGGPVAVAVALDVVPAGNGRWFAWMRDSQLTASVGFGDRVILTTTPVPANGALLSPGFQIDVGTGLFGVLSAEGQLTAYRATKTGLARVWSAELPGASGDRVRWNTSADGIVNIAWEEAPIGRVMRQSFRADGSAIGTAEGLTPMRPTAWGLSALGAPTVWVITQTDKATSLAQFPATESRTMTRLPILNDVETWDVRSTAHGKTAIVATVGTRVYSASLERPEWAVLHDGRPAERVHLVSLNGTALWGEWVEPGFGFRRALIR